MVLHSSQNADTANRQTWARLVPEAMASVLGDSDHESILREPATRVIARQLAASQFARPIEAKSRPHNMPLSTTTTLVQR